MATRQGDDRIRRILLVLAGLLVLGEVGVRIYEGWLVDGEVGALTSFVEVRDGYWVIRPEIAVVQPSRHGDIRYSFNKEGFRDRDHQASEARHRVLFLGDSVSFGLGVGDDEPYPRLIEAELARRAAGRSRFAVMNLGIFAYSPANELAVLREYGRAFAPELVVLQLYMNDFSQGPGESRPEPSLWQRIVAVKNMVVNRSALWRRARQGVYGLANWAVHDMRRRHFPETLNDREPRQVLETLEAEPDDLAFDAFRSILAIRDAVAAMGASFLVFLSPNEVQLYSDAYDAINARVAAFCSGAGIPFYDPLEELRALPARETLFHDGLHFSPRGHALLAERLLAQLQTRLAWPAPTR